MLTNTIKRLVFFARSTKRVQNPASQIEQNSQTDNAQYSHPISNTLKKIDKRYNEAVQRQQMMERQIQQQMNSLRRGLVDQNQKRRKKQEKIKQAEIHLQNLQIPPNLRERFKNLQRQKQSINNDPNSKSQVNKQRNQELFKDQQEFLSSKQLLESSKVRGKFIKSEKQAQQLKKMVMQPQDPLASQKLRQQMILQQIVKKAKSKQAKLNLPKQWQKQLQQQKKRKQQESYILNQKLRYKKLHQISNQQYSLTQKQLKYTNSQLKRLDRLKQQHKIQISQDQLWRSQYSPQLIQKALEYKNKELHYFKELVEGDLRDSWDARRQSVALTQTKQDKALRKKRLYEIQKQKKQAKQIKGIETQKVQEQGLVRFQDEEYYRQKGLKQYKQSQNLSQYDRLLKQQGEIDLQKGQKLSDIFLDEVLDPAEGRIQRLQKYQKSTFGKYEKKLNQMCQRMDNLGIQYEYQDLALVKKEQLFSDKKLQQQNQSYKQYLIKKQKKKHMKQQLKKVHKQKLRQDLNYDYQVDPVKLEQLNPLEMQQGFKKMQEIKKIKQSTIVPQQYLKQKIHHTKTLRMMTSFISAYFYNKLQNQHNNINTKVQVGNILGNPKNTVLNVFWNFHPDYQKIMNRNQFNEEDFKKQRNVLQKLLQKQSKYISAKMTQYLGLRYGPDIRFYFNEKTQQTLDSYRQMKKYKDQIVQLTVEQYKQKNVIKTKQQEQQYRKKITALINNNLQDINNQSLLINKNYQKKKRLEEKLNKRKQLKSSKNKSKQAQNNQFNKSKKYMTQKQKQDELLNKIIKQKVQNKKQSIFTPYIQDQQLYFGTEKEFLHNKKSSTNMKFQNKNQKEQQQQKIKKIKSTPVQKLWDQIEKGI